MLGKWKVGGSVGVDRKDIGKVANIFNLSTGQAEVG